MLQKLCLACNTTKPVTAFAKNKSKKDGLQYRCRDCWAAYRTEHNAKICAAKREHYEKNKERLLAEKKNLYLQVADQKRKYQRDYASKNSEKIKEKLKVFHEKNPDYYKEFRKRYSAKINAKEVRRKAAKLQRTPAWLTDDDHWLIEQAYDLAAIRTKMFGFQWHVDHEIPLLGKNVSGLHVPQNLRVIPGLVNMSKGNKFEV